MHPAVVHVPLGLAFVLPLVMAGLAFAAWRDTAPRRVWLVAVVVQAALVAGGVAALETGERDEDRVERLVGAAAVEAHEEAGERFVWAAGIVLTLAAMALALPARAGARVAAAAATGAVAVAALAFVAGRAGGELVYTRGAASAYAAPGRATADPMATHRHRHAHDD